MIIKLKVVKNAKINHDSSGVREIHGNLLKYQKTGFFLRNEQKNSRVPPKKNFNRLIILKVNLN